MHPKLNTCSTEITRAFTNLNSDWYDTTGIFQNGKLRNAHNSMLNVDTATIQPSMQSLIYLIA
jgi:hypothetical protein